MSLQAIAGVAYDRRNPSNPSSTERMRIAAAEITPDQPARSTAQITAKQVNNSLEALKRYIPTEFLALYIPFISIASDTKKARPPGGQAVEQAMVHAEVLSQYIYVGFIIATPLAVFLIFIAKAAEAGKERSWHSLPLFEATLATVSFAVWGASVPSIFPGQQWWLSMLAMASAFILPLIDTAFSKNTLS
ncbi:hypothetical protein ABC383_22715 [Noviherbaspirillum sp. 1P10PC]|uniref:hypothetical protein n=1 Tax=Noviherbaspirillum sp. 1P10PC TaxID=3132292 RepID=UPI00399FAF13